MKAVKVILGADMRLMHDGLIKLAGKCKISLEDLKAGESVLFINRARDRLKAYSWNQVVSYVRFLDKNRVLDMTAIDEIPMAFSKDGTLDYNLALKRTLEKRLAKGRRFKEVEVL